MICTACVFCLPRGAQIVTLIRRRNPDTRRLTHLKNDETMNLLLLTGGRRRTTPWLAMILAAACLTAVTLRAEEDEDVITTEKVVRKATPQFVEQLLGKLDLDYKEASKNSYLIQLAEMRMLILIQTGDLQLYIGFKGVRASVNRINEWNRTHRFSRAYIDKDNDPVLESDLDFAGGVTLDTIKNFITLFESSAKAYKEFLAK